MLLTARIRLESPLLGDKHTGAGIRRFSRVEKRMEKLPLPTALWSWALSQAAEALGVEFSDDMVRVAPHIRCPAIVMHARQYSSKSGQRRKDMFESVRAGTVLEIPFMVFSRPSPDAAVPSTISLEDFRKVLETTGSMVGVSPWGSKFGYGRFVVLGVRTG